jgi:hypothetical protein
VKLSGPAEEAIALALLGFTVGAKTGKREDGFDVMWL